MILYAIEKLIKDDFQNNETEIRYLMNLYNSINPKLDTSYVGAWYQKESDNFNKLADAIHRIYKNKAITFPIISDH